MSFPRYPAYKPSGVEWLGEVPEHWDVKPVFAVASERDESNKGMKEDNLLSLSYGSIVNKDINTSDGLLPESFDTYQIISPGDIVLRLTDLQNDKRSLRSALATQRGIITSAYLALQPEGIESRYLSYLLRAYDVSKVFYSMGGGLRQSMKFSDVKRMPVVLPGKTEQADIAAFLDRETAKIDALIDEQKRLIELLQEKRQAVISHAVTKGLNPDAPMKDSGVEWLGEVPEHWEVRPIKHLCDIYSGFPFKSDLFQEDGIPVVRMSNISGGCIDLQDAICVPEHEVPAEAFIRTGDLLLGLSGSVGNFGIATEKDLPAAVNQRVALIRTSNPILKHFLGSSLFSDQVTCGLPSTTIANVSAAQLGNCLLAVPPCDEQEQIEALLLDFVSGSTKLMTSIEASLSLLQERRSALISAAVTGQIDVRGLVAEDSGA